MYKPNEREATLSHMFMKPENSIYQKQEDLPVE